jgi:hypothetical protein
MSLHDFIVRFQVWNKKTIYPCIVPSSLFTTASQTRDKCIMRMFMAWQCCAPCDCGAMNERVFSLSRLPCMRGGARVHACGIQITSIFNEHLRMSVPVKMHEDTLLRVSIHCCRRVQCFFSLVFL